MSIHVSAHSPGVFLPAELMLLRGLINDMRGESWFPRQKADEERLAALLLKSYDRGMACPVKLKACCARAANLQVFSSEAAR